MSRGIIFDMDGTLWDSAESVANSWNDALALISYKREPITKQDMYSVMGKTMDVIADIIFGTATKQERSILLDKCCEVENEYIREHGGELYPGVRETLEKLKDKYELYIVSNCQKGYIEAFLDYYSMWNLFKDIECYGNNGLKKGQNIAKIVERNDLIEAIYVGDIQGDYDASKEAGVGFIHAKYGFGEIEQTVAEISDISELPIVINDLL